MTTEEFYREIADMILVESLTEETVLALMLLLHTHCIVLRAPGLEDRPNVRQMFPLTQRHAAEIVADSSSSIANSGAEVKNYAHWYMLFNMRTPFEVVEDIPEDWIVRVEGVKRIIAGHSVVDSVIPDS